VTSSYYILVAEDNPTVRHVMVRTIQNVAPEALVIEATNGSEALAALQRYSFEIIITDYRMPDTVGPSLITAIRKHDPHVPIIVISASLEVEWTARTAGANYFIGKPFPMETLMQQLREVLAAR
jgi:CheY-like chemotaxis protein